MRTIQEKGYIIPVKRKLSDGVYKKAHARSLEPNIRGNVKVAFDSGKTSEWSHLVTIHEPAGFITRNKFKPNHQIEKKS